MFPAFADTVRFSEASIFYCISSNTISHAKVSELVEATFWFPFYCTFVIDTDRVMEALRPEQEIPAEQLSKLSQYAPGFVTDAYDLDGLLLWTKQEMLNLDNPFL
jgi:hypothetical protein